MPLFNEQTNLAGQGRFSPGVTYYAGIRAPSQPIPSLPKSDSSFNIDLSSIGNAMIAAKESETKLGMAALEMEQNLQQAEKDRELRRDLAAMEDARARDIAAMQEQGANARLDKELASKWQIASMKNDTELEKLKYQKASSLKDQTKAMANLALSTDKELREKYIDYANGNLGELEWNSLLNEKINTIATNTGANVQDLYTAANSIGYKQGIGATVQANVDEAKTLRNNQLTQDIALGGTLSPQASESDKATIGAEFRETMQNTINTNRVLSPGSGATQMERDMARRVLERNQDKLIDTVMLRSMTNVYNNMRNVSNPVEFLEASKDAIALEIAQSTGSDYGQVRRRTDAMFKLYQVDNTLKDITTLAGDDSTFVKNAYDTYLNQYRLGTLKNSSMLKAAVAFGSDFIKGLPESRQEGFYNVMANDLIGNIQQNYTWTDESGVQHTGYRWSRRGNEPLSYDNVYVSELADELGMTPMGAVYYLASEAMKEAPTSLKTNKMLPKDGENLLQNSVMTLSGNPNKDLSAAGMTAEQVISVQNNIDTCVQSGRCTPQQLHEFSEALPEPYRTSARHIENKWSGAAKLGRYLGGGSEAALFYESVNYLNPNNLTLAEIKQVLGKKVSEKDKNSLQLKNTQSFYTVKDGRVYIDFTQQGLIKTGEEELQKRATYVRHQLERAGLTEEEQIDFYNRFYPNMTNVDPRTGDKLPIWMQDAFSVMQDYTIGRGAAVDTQFASWLDNKNKEWLNRNRSESNTMTADEAFNMLKEETEPGETRANAVDMITNEPIYIAFTEPDEIKTTDGVRYAVKIGDGQITIDLGKDIFRTALPLDISEEELVANLKNNPEETVQKYNMEWARKTK